MRNRATVSALLALCLGESILMDRGSSVHQVTRDEDPEGLYWRTRDMGGDRGERVWTSLLDLVDWLEGK